MNVFDAIRLKRAVRNFTSEPLPKETILAILNAGRRAQSSKNTQPWHFIAITDKAILKQLSECGAGPATRPALPWAWPCSPRTRKKFQRLFDLGQAAAYMQLAAWELGVGSCLASIYEPDKARQLLGFPADLHQRIAISFGYPADESSLAAQPKKGGRRALPEILHWNRW
jgi:nitroreductase